MKLYIAKGSTSCRKVLATAHHLGLHLEFQSIEFYSDSFDEVAFAKMNPNGMVPLLKDGDFCLWESTAIMHYLVDKKPGSGLVPQDPKLKADVLRWQAWALAHFGAACDLLIWENILKNLLEGGIPDPTRIKEGERTFLQFAPVLDRHLAGKHFLVGSGVTLADFTVGAPLGFVEAAKIPWSDFSNIRRWYGNLESLDAWKKSAPGH